MSVFNQPAEDNQQDAPAADGVNPGNTEEVKPAEDASPAGETTQPEAK